MVREVRGTPQAPTRAELRHFVMPVVLQFRKEESIRSSHARATRRLPEGELRGIRRRGGSKRGNEQPTWSAAPPPLPLAAPGAGRPGMDVSVNVAVPIGDIDDNDEGDAKHDGSDDIGFEAALNREWDQESAVVPADPRGVEVARQGESQIVPSFTHIVAVPNGGDVGGGPASAEVRPWASGESASARATEGDPRRNERSASATGRSWNGTWSSSSWATGAGWTSSSWTDRGEWRQRNGEWRR